jgi:integrase
MVFQVKGKGPFKARVVAPSGESATLSTGMYTREDADAVDTTIEQWEGKRGRQFARPNVLEALVAKRLTLRLAYDKHLDGTLDAHMAALDAGAGAIDYRPLVAQWHLEKSRSKKGAASADEYRRQLEQLYPLSEPLTSATFTRKELLRKIKALDVQEPTRNRFKAAASSFAALLVDEELIEFNFVRTIPGWSENAPREVYYLLDDAKRLIAGLPQPYAAIAAYAAGFCAEWGAIERWQAGDIVLDEDPVHSRVRGTKRDWRDRVVPLVPELAWVLPYIRPVLKGKMPTAVVFAGIPEWRAIDVIRDTARELKIHAINEDVYGEHSIHDWRHSHSVWLAQFDYPPAIGAAHLGHSDTGQWTKRYSKHRPGQHDYARAQKKAAERRKARESAGKGRRKTGTDSTKSATTARRRLT